MSPGTAQQVARRALRAVPRWAVQQNAV